MNPGITGKLLVRLVLLSVVVLTPLAAKSGQYWEYTVRPGDTIWSLAEKHTTSVLHWQKIQRINNLPDEPARGIMPGTRLRFPVNILKHQPVPANVRLVRGEAQLVREGAEPSIIASGTELNSGDRILVGEDSNLTIRFADGSELLVLGGSELVMDSLSAYGETGMVDTRVRLLKGRVDTRVKRSRGPGSRYEIITPAAVAAVRGTDFRVAADTKEAVSRSEVLEGIVDVTGQDASQRVLSGFGVIARQDQPPDKPKPLLPAPDLSPQQDILDRLPLQFRWERVEGAVAYHFQVADNSNFDSLLADATSTGGTGFLADLPDGDYVLRVRGIDNEGLEGLNAVRDFTVAAHPEPPVPMNAGGSDIVRDPMPRLDWSRPENIDRFRFQMARDESFDSRLYDEEIENGLYFKPGTGLTPGSYYWRVASIDAQGKQGPPSDVSAFEYKPVPETPEPAPPAIKEDSLSFSWRSAGEDMRYRFQMAEDADFSQVVIDQTVATPAISATPPGDGDYFFRVQAIDETGYAGPWSTTQSFSVPGNPWYLLLPFILLLLA